MFENPRRARQETKFSTNVPKILDLKSSPEQIFSENCRWVPLQYEKQQVLKFRLGTYVNLQKPYPLKGQCPDYAHARASSGLS